MASSVSEYGGAPVIGISSYVERARYGVWDNDTVLIPRSYVDSVAAAGGTSIVLPSIGQASAEVLARLDAIVLAGGADVEPGRYGMPAHQKTTSTRPERDTFELDLLGTALAMDMPVLGVCRGMEVLNVALGGTLHQHLPDAAVQDSHQPAPATFGSTTVALEPDSLAHRVLGREVSVACYHHQGVDKLGERLRAVGWAPDGTVEAIERPGAEFVLGVQWHPEVGADPALFVALVDAAGDYRERTRP